MNPPADPREICDEIAGELRDMATWLTAGRLSPEQFRNAVLELEKAKVTRFGFGLSGAIQSDRTVEFALIFGDTGARCARMVFHPAKGELATEHLCR